MIKDRIRQLRELMTGAGVDTYIITKFDPHQTEYAPEHWNGVKFISGFTGSLATVVVTQKDAGLWTDGRYYIQAERELAGAGIELHRMMEPGVKDYMSYAAEITKKNGVIGFDGRTLSMTDGLKLLEKTLPKKITLRTDKDLLGELWADRPALSETPVFNHRLEFCGKSRIDKINAVRREIEKSGADVYVISSADDIAWLYNLRVNDQPGTTFFASYSVIDSERAAVFIDSKRSADIGEELRKDGIILKNYDEIFDYLKNYSPEQIYLVNPEKTNYSLYESLSNNFIIKCSPDITSNFKAVKNDVELRNLEKVNIRDGVAMVRFIKWIKETVGSGGLNEINADEELSRIRSGGENYLCPSFRTISAYMANAAMMHYSAGPDSYAEIKPEGILLVDSGGNYLDGTTDITRTIVMGHVSEEIKKDFTLVLKAHIALARLVFLYGSTGSNIDIVARLPLWNEGLDYKCGTGHGLGFCLNVHEGPHRISPVVNTAVLEAGMVVTNEPGIYRENKHGIRTENTLVIRLHDETEFGKFMKFETISYCPIDRRAINTEMLADDEKNWINNYHKTVYEKLCPCLTEEEKAWLKKETAPIG